MAIPDVVSDIVGSIESNNNYGFVNDSGGGTPPRLFVWQCWENLENRIVVSLFATFLGGALDSDDVSDFVSEFSSVWGVRAHDVPSVGLLHIETLRTIDQIGGLLWGVDEDGDEIIR